MKRSALYCCAALCAISFGASSALAQTPTIGAVVHAATYSPPGIPNSAIPEGGFFAVFGTNMGPTTAVTNTGAFPTTLGGVSLTLTVGGTVVSPGPLLYVVSAGQINGVLPSNTPVGSATMTVTYNSVTSAAFAFNVVKSNFGFFTENASGSGPAVAQDYTISPSTINSLTVTAKPGDTLVLYGSGLGPAVNNTVDNLDFHLYLGGTEFTSGVQYAGRSLNVALDQINFTIPSNAPTGCFIPLIIRIGSIVSNSASVSIDANGQTCNDPFGLTPAQITQATTGTLNVGSVLLTRLALNLGLPVPETQDEVDAHFYKFTGGSVSTNPDFLALSSYGSCQVATCSNTYTCVPSSSGLNLPGLDAGSALNISAPTTTVPKVSTGYYSDKLGSSPLKLGAYPLLNFLAPGSYTVAGTGGADVGAFSTSVTVPGIPNITSGTFTWSSPQFTVQTPTASRANAMTVNWQNAGSAGYMLISVGSAYEIPNSNPANYNSATITCLQPVSAGTYTIPSWLLEALPPSASVNISTLSLPTAAVLLGVYNPVGTFTAPGLDVGVANSILTSGQNLNLQ